MATRSSRQSGLFGVNDWQKIYQTFREADFKSYDYETLRKNFIDYLRLYYPETFTDYIESSEFIALLDVMAFMGQGLAFRNDLNARENFIDTAERRDSVIKLADLVSYTPKRNIAGQGYIKVTSIQTTQNLTDINGVNLSNTPILWNDPANSNWLEQFNTIINAALVDTQRIGRPGNSADILGVTTNEYTIRIPEDTLPIVPFNSTVDGQNMIFELVSVTSVDEDYVYELPPQPTDRFNMLYRNDKLGFGSPETGFFFYFKQGKLLTFDFNLQQQIANQVIDIDIQGINDTDTWLYQLNDNNGDRLFWRKVDNVYADATLQTERSEKKIFSVNSRFNDQVSYIFGDGVFSEVPVGNFRAYVRAGNAQTYVIAPSEMQGISVTITYVNRQGRNETLTIGLELPLTVSTAQARETLADIKQRAPTRYYTQNRMVNGEDYSNFPYTLYSSIIKSKAINRTSVGISKNLDLLDPTGKYSSTNSFGGDGALYLDDEEGNLKLTINNISDIISFFTNTLASVLAENRTNQYYIENYDRYPVTTELGTVFWQTSSVESSSETGYFYNVSGATNIPITIGPIQTNNAKYITSGALLKFNAPAGTYFDNNNRLVVGIAPTASQTFLWTTVLNVIGDGSNDGEGSFANGTGPVTLNGYVPTGAILEEVIPVFDNSLSTEIIQECVIRMELQQSFTLVFDNSKTINQERWSIRPITDENYFVKLTNTGDNKYDKITFRSLTYFFGSAADTRFTFSRGELVYDPFSGKIIQDFINILSINPQPNSTQSLGKDLKVSILNQPVQSDGYVDDFQVEVAATDINNRQLILIPDFFEQITGYVTGGSTIGKYVFFRRIQDAINLTREVIVPSTDIEFQYSNKSQIEVVKYDYPVGQIFYATNENTFYNSVQDPTVTIPTYELKKRTDYSVKTGRQGLSFQYRHNSNNTNRINPATTNIIDLYVVPQAYYTAYQNWIQDTTNTVPKPLVPTINELNQEYGEIQNFKMLSDSVVLNSVVFKPLFGPKADSALRATIKVIRQSSTNASDSEIRSTVLEAMNEYFNINNWDFGDTFFFSELGAYLHAECGELISSAVLVPNDPSKSFGDLYEIKCMPYEIFVNGASANDIQVVAALTPAELQIRAK
jgi:hypothetical protein